jgi:hypothetical protein
MALLRDREHCYRGGRPPLDGVRKKSYDITGETIGDVFH